MGAGLLDTMARRRGGALLVEGEAGIGRTTLLQAIAGMADTAGYTVVCADGDPLRQSYPLGAVRPLFDVLTWPDDTWPDDVEAGPAGGYRSFERWFRAVTRLAMRTPVLVIADDVHWCDDPSLRWLALLARRCPTVPIGVLAAIRSGERVDSDLLTDLASRFSRIPVTGLELEPTAEVVREVLGEDSDATFVAACHRATGGNPRLLDELLTEVTGHAAPPTAHTAGRIEDFATPAMTHALLGDVKRTDPDAAALAVAVAALDGRAELDLAGDLADLDPVRTGRAADALVRRRILRHGPPLTFAHPVLAASIAGHPGLGAAGTMHARIARLLHDGGCDEAEIAHHLMRSSTVGEPWAVSALRSAARSARVRGDPEAAIRYLERAARELATGQARALSGVLAELADALLIVGTSTKAVMLVGEVRAGASAERTEDLARRLLAAGPPRSYDEMVPYWSAVASLIRAESLGLAASLCAAADRARAELRLLHERPVAPSGRSAPVPRTASGGRSLVVRCFGGFRCDLADRPLDWSAIRPRVRSLLRFLAAHGGRPVHRETILAALWPELPAQTGIRNLHVGVSTLRTFLEPGVGRGASRFIRRDGESYLLAVPDDGQYDVRAFDDAVTSAHEALAAGCTGVVAEALRGALGHYSGDLLPEDGPAEWVVVERDRYRVAAAEAAESLARIEFDAGRCDAAIHAARRSIELDGFRDVAWRTLAEAYRSAGHTAAAEQALRAYEGVLHSLGVAQSPAGARSPSTRS